MGRAKNSKTIMGALLTIFIYKNSKEWSCKKKSKALRSCEAGVGSHPDPLEPHDLGGVVNKGLIFIHKLFLLSLD